MSSTQAQREKLDVESTQAREARIGNLLSSISSPSAQSPTNQALSSMENPIPSKPTAVPESNVLARVRDFLPKLEASNKELKARAAENPDSVNMEKVNDGQAIAMDLGLGVFDAPNDSKSDLGPIVNSNPPADLAQSSDDSDSESDSSDDSSSSSGSESDSTSEEQAKPAP